MTSPSIFIVEDELIVAEDIRQTLTGLGYTVVGHAKSGELAIGKVKETKPDLVLMDIHLAGKMDGIETAGRIRSLYDIPVIYLTAHADTVLLERAKITEPYGYILKPYDERELHSVIQMALYKHDLNRILRESEERYRGFVENFLGIAFRKRPDFTPEFYHGAVEAITGYTERDLMAGAPIWASMVYPDDRPRVEAENQRIITTPHATAGREYRVIRRDGIVRWVYEQVQNIADDHGTTLFIQGACYDITERKEAEQLLKKLNEELEVRVAERTVSLNQQVLFLQQLIDTIPSPIYYKNPRRFYLGCNSAFESYLGIPRAGIIGKTDDEILPPESAEISEARDTFLLQHQGIQVYQSKFSHAEQSTRDVLFKKATFDDREGRIAGLIGVMLDITDQIQAAESLRESERRFKAVVQDQTELICRFSHDRTILFANDAFLRYFGRNVDDTIGFIFRPPVHPDDRRIVEQHFAALTPDNPAASIEYRVLKPDHSVRWQQWNNRAFFDDGGNVTEFQSVGRDITAQKESEEIRREAYRQIEKNLAQFATLNDQIKNPLTVIVMLASMDDGENAKKILSRAEEIDRILQQLHDGWIESEKVRAFLKKNYGIEGG